VPKPDIRPIILVRRGPLLGCPLVREVFVVASRVERRLTAILCADVVGYSRLMGADQEGTHAALKALRRELVDPALAEHQGRIVKTTGDGLLVEFPSVVDAVRCAVLMQEAMRSATSILPRTAVFVSASASISAILSSTAATSLVTA